MKFKGQWLADESYSIGDVVIYADDGTAYHLFHPCAAGTTPMDSMYWKRLDQFAGEIVIMLNDMFEELFNRIPTNISDESIVLKGTEDAEYLITIDDSGDTPEVIATLIEPDEEEGDE